MVWKQNWAVFGGKPKHEEEKKGKRAECTLQSDIFLFPGTFPYFCSVF